MSYYTVAFTPSAPSQQQELIRLIRQYNQDENLWQSLEGRRRLSNFKVRSEKRQ